MGSKIMQFFGMFDRVDDIIYEPVKAACEWVRQPLHQLKLSNDRKMAEHAQQLELEMVKVKNELELERRKQEIELSDEEKRRNVEIENMIQEAAINRQEEMMQLEMKYRTELADLNARMTKLMSEMQAEAIRSLFSLIEEKKKSYLEIQCAYRKELVDTVKELQELGVDKDTTQPILIDGFKKISEESTMFQSMLVKCVEKASETTNEDARRASKRMDDYFRTRENEPSLLPSNNEMIEQKTYD